MSGNKSALAKEKIKIQMEDLRRRTDDMNGVMKLIIDTFDKLYNVAFDLEWDLSQMLMDAEEKQLKQKKQVKPAPTKRQKKKAAVEELSKQVPDNSGNLVITPGEYTEL